MSTHSETRRRTPLDIVKAAAPAAPSVWLTAYSAPVARRLDPLVDVLLVGDSVGTVIYGLPSTLGVTLDMMVAHGAAVVRATKQALVVVDLPFGSYQESPAQAFRNAARLMAETGCGAVKLEGGVEMAETIAFLVARGIPVCAHIGLMPQSVNTAGGFRAQGRTEESAARIGRDAQAVAEAGAFAVVIEGTAEPVARRLTESLAIPTIGIGASPACDGQVLVTDDMAGMFDAFKPRFVKRYADLGAGLEAAASAYAAEVRRRAFPAAEHCYGAAKK